MSMEQHYTPDPDVGLFGGRWVPTGRGTVRWQQERQPAPMPPELVLPPCRRCGEAFDRPGFSYCSTECSTTARTEARRRYDRTRKPKKGCCQDCGAPTWYAGYKRCRVCAVASRDSAGRWVA